MAGITTRLYHAQITEKMKRLKEPEQYPVADRQTFPTLTAIPKQPVSELPQSSMHREEGARSVFCMQSTTKQPAVRLPVFRLRKQGSMQSNLSRDEYGTLTLRTKRSNLPTEALVQQEVLRFWQLSSGRLPSAIFLSPRRYKELEMKYYSINGRLVPCEADNEGDDIRIRSYFQ